MKVSAGELMAAAAAAAAVSPEINQLSANMHLHKYNLEPEGLVQAGRRVLSLRMWLTAA